MGEIRFLLEGKQWRAGRHALHLRIARMLDRALLVASIFKLYMSDIYEHKRGISWIVGHPS